jgi:hypothetical protein
MWKHLLLIAGVICVGEIATADETPINIFDKTSKFEGSEVASPNAARELALKEYLRKMEAMLANEGIRSVSIVKLGYNIPEFANKGERIWEVRVGAYLDEFRSIIWINPTTAKVRFLTGPWEERVDKK